MARGNNFAWRLRHALTRELPSLFRGGEADSLVCAAEGVAGPLPMAKQSGTDDRRLKRMKNEERVKKERGKETGKRKNKRTGLKTRHYKFKRDGFKGMRVV
ncbi:MAG TPA: hypothetical protein VKP58_00120 [Candidatus Acidoferrum sp.]|nr:hypothetical protein [Candidatus Acidoferrum sp.]